MSCFYKQKGFTLIEMLVYIALLLLITSALIMTFLSLDDTLVRNQTERTLTQEASVTLEHLLHHIRRADYVIDASGNSLELYSVYGTTRYYLSGGIIMVEDASGHTGSLTTDSVSVRELEFTHFIGDNTDLVRVEMKLSAETKAASSTRAYFGSAVLRGSYE